VIGRFLSTDPDPVGGLGTNFNRYAYVGNNPYRAYKKIDPEGMTFNEAIIAEERRMTGGGDKDDDIRPELKRTEKYWRGDLIEKR
jgi:uncharacterized protein RhaS with RHS repeats